MVLKGPVIVVDDDPDDQLLITNALRQLNTKLEIKVFNDGKEVLEYLLADTESPFLILCDIQMPRLDGIALREKMEMNETLRKKSIPFVYITGSASTSDVLKAYGLSVQGFFTKPNLVEDWEKLITMIVHYWDECIHPNSLSKTDK